ncbi:MAG: hypothetical protein JNM56_17450 [Planctomycetia bacterium]|nr:hypothetical protein [Planctomycetia bacterium]
MKHWIAVWICALGSVAPALAQDAAPLVKFDCRELELRRVRDRWEVRGGANFVKDLGTNEADAKEALRLIRELRLSEHGTIGTRQPVIEYWLADKQPPVGMVARHRQCVIDLKSLQVVSIHGHWCVRDNRQLWFNFGVCEQDARQTVELLQRYQFNRVIFVGQGAPILMAFMASSEKNGEPNQQLAAPLAISPGQWLNPRQLTAPSMFTVDPKGGGERLPIDWRNVQLRREGQDWKLKVGNENLADFGSDEIQAREALRVFQYYRFSELCRVGQTEKPLTFYLVNGQAPRGIKFGVRSTSFRPERLSVRQNDDGWMIYDGEKPILRGGDSFAAARQVLDTIKKHGFDCWCSVGKPGRDGLGFFARER